MYVDMVPPMWLLSPDVHHLNHGSFGAVPLEVLEKQNEWRARWEADTTGFIVNDLQTEIDAARATTSAFLNADVEGFVFLRNASAGVASVLRSIEHTLKPGDELLTTVQDYNAIRQILEFTAARHDARVVVAPIPFPIDSPNQVTESILGSTTDRTRLAVIDHVTSPTGLVFPIDQIVSSLEPDIPVLVDGAHGPGQVPVDLRALGASWYTGNLHKWTCAPKGSAFLHTCADRIEDTVPTVISHGWNAPIPEGRSRYWALFDWPGTDDMSQWLVVPDALRVVGGIEPGGWPALMKRNHELALSARDLLCQSLGVVQPAPDEMVGAMAAIPLTDGKGDDPGGDLSPLMFELLADGFETIVMIWPEWPNQLLRVSAAAYNTLDEYRALANRLSDRVG
jgi:isopenicillin-N epimerase